MAKFYRPIARPLRTMVAKQTGVDWSKSVTGGGLLGGVASGICSPRLWWWKMKKKMLSIAAAVHGTEGGKKGAIINQGLYIKKEGRTPLDRPHFQVVAHLISLVKKGR